MKNKLIGLMLGCILGYGLSGYSHDEDITRRLAFDEKNLKIAREIIKLYTNLMVIKEWDPLSDEMWRAGYRAGWDKAMCASWGTACGITLYVMRDIPADKCPFALFTAVKQRQKVIEAAILKEKIDTFSLEALEQAMIDFLALAHKRLADENLNRAIPGLRGYYVKAIASVVALYLEVAPASDGKGVGERFEELFMAIVPSELFAIGEEEKGAHQQVSKGAAQAP